MVSLTNHSVKQASYMPLMLVKGRFHEGGIMYHSNIPLMWRWIQRSFHMAVNPCGYKVHFHARRMLYNIKMVLQSKLPTTTTKPKVNYLLRCYFVIEFERLQTESPHKLNNKKFRCINYNVTLKQVNISWLCHLSVKLGVHFSIQNNKSIKKKINKDIYLMHCS